jgi:hypothetical protein
MSPYPTPPEMYLEIGRALAAALSVALASNLLAVAASGRLDVRYRALLLAPFHRELEILCQSRGTPLGATLTSAGRESNIGATSRSRPEWISINA